MSLPPPISTSMLAMPALPAAQPAYQQPLILQNTPAKSVDHTNYERSMGIKFRNAVLVAVMFVVLSSHAAFRVLNQIYVLLSNSPMGLLDDHQCASMTANIVMGAVVFVITFFFILT